MIEVVFFDKGVYGAIFINGAPLFFLSVARNGKPGFFKIGDEIR